MEASRALRLVLRTCWTLAAAGFLIPAVQNAPLAQSPRAKPLLEVGIDRSNLIWASKHDQAAIFSGIQSLHVSWFRDGFAYPATRIADFVSVVRQAKQANLKMLVILLPDTSDYDGAAGKPSNGGPAFQKLCGWPTGSLKLSQIDLGKFKSRLRGLLDGLKAANLDVDAFEIGNEADWVCFNGDVPFDRDATPADTVTAARGYAHFLQAAAVTIRDSKYFPQAKIITFGMAHIQDAFDPSPRHHLQNPAAFVASLRRLDGFDYLSNSSYHIDGIGSHLYPDPSTVGQSVTRMLDVDTAALGADLPIWITEFGWRTTQFPTKNGKSRADVIREFFAVLGNDHRNAFGPAFYYAYDDDGFALIDKAKHLLPEARVLAQVSK